MSFEILFPFGLWVSEPGWLLNHSQLVWRCPCFSQIVVQIGSGCSPSVNSGTDHMVLCVYMCNACVCISTRAIWRHRLLVMSYCVRQLRSCSSDKSSALWALHSASDKSSTLNSHPR